MTEQKKLRHENFTELAEFARAVYAEYSSPGSELRNMFKAGLSSPAPEAFQQFIIEVGSGYGFGGISHMTPEQWFNSDLPLRQRDADTIAGFYERYKAVADEPVTEANDVQKELDALRKQLKDQAAAIAKLTEAVEDESEADAAAEEKKKAEEEAAKAAEEEKKEE